MGYNTSAMAQEPDLEQLIHTGHLEPETYRGYREAFASDPLRIVVLKHILFDEIAERLSSFMRREAVFKRVCGLYSDAERYGNITDVAEDTWLATDESMRFYRFGEFDPLRDEYRSSTNYKLFQDFLTLIRSKRFKGFLEGISGLLFGSTPVINAYSYGPGDFLALHSDDVRDKRLSFVFYLSPGWERRFGGLLSIGGIDESATNLEFEPEYNSLAIFDVTARTEHQITPVNLSAGQLARVTISGWFLKPDAA